MKTSLILFFLIFSSCFAFGEIYSWEDAEAIHFTDNPDSIPEKYRENIIEESREEMQTQNSEVVENLPPKSNQVNYENKNVTKYVTPTVEYPVNTYVTKNLREDFAPFSKPLAAAILISATILIGWIIILADIISSEFSEYSKTKWLLLVLFTVPLGMLLYLMFGLEQKYHIVAHYQR